MGSIRLKKRWVETIKIPRQITETYVDYETKKGLKNFEAYRLKFTEDEMF